MGEKVQYRGWECVLMVGMCLRVWWEAWERRLWVCVCVAATRNINRNWAIRLMIKRVAGVWGSQLLLSKICYACPSGICIYPSHSVFVLPFHQIYPFSQYYRTVFCIYSSLHVWSFFFNSTVAAYLRTHFTVFISLVILSWCKFIYEEISECNVNKSGNRLYILRAKGGVVPPSVHI